MPLFAEAALGDKGMFGAMTHAKLVSNIMGKWACRGEYHHSVSGQFTSLVYLEIDNEGNFVGERRALKEEGFRSWGLRGKVSEDNPNRGIFLLESLIVFADDSVSEWQKAQCVASGKFGNSIPLFHCLDQIVFPLGTNEGDGNGILNCERQYKLGRRKK